MTHRTAFQRRLVDQPLMRNVLADLALEVEGAVAYSMRLGRAIDEREQDPMAAAFARMGQQSVNSGYANVRQPTWKSLVPRWVWLYRRKRYRSAVVRRLSTASGKVRATSYVSTFIMRCNAKKPRCLGLGGIGTSQGSDPHLDRQPNATR